MSEEVIVNNHLDEVLIEGDTIQIVTVAGLRGPQGDPGTQPSLSDQDPDQVDASGSGPGTGTEASRWDHKHNVATGIPIDVGLSNVEGISPDLARSDHTHDITFTTINTRLGQATTPIAFNGQIITAIATPVGSTDGATKGYVDTQVATKVGFDGVTPSPVGLSAAVGSAAGAPHSDHVHALGFSTVQSVIGGASSAIDVNSQKITSLANGTSPTDAVNLSQLQAVVLGLTERGPAVAVGAVPVTLSGLAQVVDGVAIDTVDMTVLVAAQVDAKTNGFWLAKSGAWVRPANFQDGTDANGAFTFVDPGGTLYGSSGWWCLSTPAVIGTDDLSFIQFTSLSDVLAGNGLDKTGNTIFAVPNPDGSIVVTGSGIGVGILASDAQHGARGGGSQHIDATGSVSGFMPAAAVTKLAGISPNAAALTSVAPSNVGTSAVVGTGTAAAREDHVHAITFATVNSVLGTANADIGVNSRKITSLATPTATTDAATFGSVAVILAGAVDSLITRRPHASAVLNSSSVGMTCFGTDSTGLVPASFGNWAMMGGGDQNQSSADYTFSTGLQNQAQGPACFVAGQGNIASGNSTFVCGASNSVTGSYSRAGGQSNTLGGSATHSDIWGHNCVVSQTGSQAGGIGSHATGPVSLAIGLNNIASGTGAWATCYSTNAGGDYSFTANYATNAAGAASCSFGYVTQVDAGADYSESHGYATQSSAISSSASGVRSRTLLESEEAFSSGRFSNNGDCQVSRVIMRGNTTSSGPNETIELKFGEARDQYLVLENFRGYLLIFEAMANSSGTFCGFTQSYVVQNSGGLSTLVPHGTPVSSPSDANSANWTLAVDTTTSPTRIRVQFDTGADTRSIHVAVGVRMVKVTQ